MDAGEPSPTRRGDQGDTTTSPGEPPSARSAAQSNPLPTPFSAPNNAPSSGKDKELHKQDSFAARVRAARRVPTLLRDNSTSIPAAPPALFRWETRGHFWSELEKSPMDGNRADGSSVHRFGQAASMWCRAASVSVKNVWAVVRRKPSILLWPLLLLAVLLAAGIVGVTLSANDYETSSQDDAMIAGAKAVNALQLVVERALQPLRAAEVVVQLQPAMAVLGPSLQRISTRPLDQAPPVISSLFLSPFGLVRASVTPRYESPATAAVVTPPLGTLLMPGEPLRLGQLQDIMLRVPDWLPPGSRVSSGPATATTTTGTTGGGAKAAATSALLVVHKPVLIINARPTDAWNNSSPCGSLPPPTTGPDTDSNALTSNPSVAGGHCLFLPSNTSATAGATPAATAAADGSSSGGGGVAVNGTRLWGFVSGLVRVEDLVQQPAAGLQQLRSLGYLWRLTIRAAPLPGAAAPVAATVTCDTPPSDGSPVLPVVVLDAEWQLELEKKGGHRPSWEAPLLAVVVLASLALSALLLAALVIQQRHLILLEAMLPKKVIKLLGTGRPFYQHYEGVTVLYADIIRYSNAPAGMPPQEVVSLLNDVHNMYDSLLDKHGLIKIRRSGEAFLGVGGCPTAEDPVRAALRAALCAREMVLATAAFRSSAGQRVQIRLGLHSGPVVAAVVGTHMPRFSLFGDTIDISHFMEATSSVMRVHVSDTTAELLTIADDPLVSLQPRGVIDVRGRGAITTSWLRLDLLSSVTSLGPSRQLTMAGDRGGSRASAQPSLQAPWADGDGGERDSGVGTAAGGAAASRASAGGGAADGRASAGDALALLAAAGASRGGSQQQGPAGGVNAHGSGGGAGGGRGGGGGGDGSVRGGRAGGPREAPSDIACAADLAVAAAMGVRGAPLVRKLSQTGLTQTRRALPDRRQREGVAAAAAAAVERSMLGSFTLRLEEVTVGAFRSLLAAPLPPPVLVRGADDDGDEEEAVGIGGVGGTGGGGGGVGGGRYDLRDVTGWMSAPKPPRKWRRPPPPGQEEQGDQPKQEVVVAALAEKVAAPPAAAAAVAVATSGGGAAAEMPDAAASAVTLEVPTDAAAAAVGPGDKDTPAHLATVVSDTASSSLGVPTGAAGDMAGGSRSSSSRRRHVVDAEPTANCPICDEPAATDTSRWGSSGSSSMSRREAAAGVQAAVAVGGSSIDGEHGVAKRAQQQPHRIPAPVAGGEIEEA